MNKLVLILFLLLNTYSVLFSQTYYFKHYQVENGLSNNTVMCSAQDKLGFMWFGTRDGVNRFDGYSFKVYRFPNKLPGSIGSNFIHELHVDKNGTLWAGTEAEIHVYDPAADSFRLVTVLPRHLLKEFTLDSAGNIWMIASWTLLCFEKQTRTLRIYDQPALAHVTSLCLDQAGELWLSNTSGELLQFDRKSGVKKRFDLYRHSPLVKNKFIYKISAGRDGQILAGPSSSSFKQFSIAQETYKDISLTGKKREDLFIRNFLETDSGEIWIGTETGIFVYNEQTETAVHLRNKGNDQYTISNNVVYTICRDKEGGIWAGTYFGGLNYYPHQYTPFKKFYRLENENSLNGNVVRDMLKDEAGNLWIGTTDAGLNKQDAATGDFKHFQADGKAGSLSHNNLNTLLLLGRELWIGNFDHGLDVLNTETGKVVRHYEANGRHGLRSNYIYGLYQTNEKETLAATLQGMYRYNRSTDHFDLLPHFPVNNWYTCVLKDAGGTIWAGVYGKGIYYSHPASGQHGYLSHQPANENSIGSNMINAIYEDRTKTVWFATENGLCKWDPARRSFRRFTTANGLPVNFVVSILEDEEGKLWLGTTRGLVAFNPATEKMQTFTTANGLLSDQFNIKSAYKDADGQMYFGCSKGFVSFYPSSFSQSRYTPPLYLTSLQINNQEISSNSTVSPLKESIAFTRELTLLHNQSSFSIEFSALSYTAPEVLEYAYYLEGLSTGWTYLGKNHKVFFTNLVPGHYTLRLKATNSSGLWQAGETTLPIVILPPWWQSNLAYTVYALLTLLLSYWIIRSYHQRTEEKNKRKIERIEMEKEKEILQLEIAKEKEIIQSKIDFFTNVAHEIRTPLTLIKIPLAKIIRKTTGQPEIENSLKIIQRNTDRLVDLSNQLLDFRQTEISEFKLNIAEANITELLSNAYQSFSSLAEQGGIRFEIRLPATALYADIDVDAFNKIMYNLCSNAIKYAGRTVSIDVLPARENKKCFTVVVKNDGFLIPESLREKIFEPFYRLPETEKQKGTGIGLTLSRSLAQLHNGQLYLAPPENGQNVFVLTLPVKQPSGAGKQAPLPSSLLSNDENRNHERNLTAG